MVDGLFVDGEDLGAGVAVLQVEVAGGFELDGLVVGIGVDARDVDFEVGVVENVLLALLDGGGRGRRQRRLGLRRFGRGRRLGRLGRRDLLVGEGGELDRVGLA